MKKTFLISAAFGVAMILTALAAKYAETHGYIGAEVTMRIVAMDGLFVAWMGNSIPKAVVPQAWARKSRRFTGWMLVSSGLLYTVLWAFAPLMVAEIFGTGAIAAGVVLSVGYCMWLNAQRRRAAAV